MGNTSNGHSTATNHDAGLTASSEAAADDPATSPVICDRTEPGHGVIADSVQGALPDLSDESMESAEPVQLPTLDSLDDPNVINYNGVRNPISRLPPQIMEEFMLSTMLHCQSSQEVAVAEAVRAELVLRVQRWTRFYGFSYNENLFTYSDADEVKNVVRSFENYCFDHGKAPMTLETYNRITGQPDITQEAHAVSYKLARAALKMISTVNFKQRGSPESELKIKSLFNDLGLNEITDKEQQLKVKVKAMEEWWSAWLKVSPWKKKTANPFSAIIGDKAHADLPYLSEEALIRKLADLAAGSDPKEYFFGLKNTGWPGFDEFALFLSSFLTELLSCCTDSFDFNDERIQKSQAAMEFARLFCPEPIWIAAFIDGPPRSLNDLFQRVEAQSSSPHFTPEKMFQHYGILAHGGLTDNVFDPRYSRVGLNEAANETIPNNALSAILPNFRPTSDSGAPLYLVAHSPPNKRKRRKGN